MFGTEQVGYYSFGLMTYSAFKTLPTTLSNYIYPKFSYALGQKKSLKKLWGYAWKANAIMLSLMFLFAIAGYFLTPIIVNVFFQKYVMGINSTRILLFAAVFAGSSIGGTLILSMKAWKAWIILQVGGGGFIALSVYFCLRMIDNHLIAASTGLFIGQLLFFILSNVLTYQVTHKKHIMNV
jgi:O-antigen/teichoic acid export membrane protein